MPKKERIISGIPVSEGIAIGSICLYRTELDDIREYNVELYQISYELDRYFSAINEVSLQFMDKQNHIARDIGSKHAEIYEAYRLILEDPLFQEDIPETIRQVKKNAEYVIHKKLLGLQKQFETIKDEYLRERIYDVRGVSRRIIYNLTQQDSYCDFDRFTDNILLARELTPVDSIYFQHRALKGIATEYGGKTSHAAILAHSLEIAAIVGAENLLKHAKNGSPAIIDGFNGQVILNPAKETEISYRNEMQHWESRVKRFKTAIEAPTPVISGRKIRLLANINDETEIAVARRYLAEGVGLFRTELQFIAKERFLKEDEQFEIYRNVLRAFPSKEVVIRLLDMGGDKFIPLSQEHHELNPFLGWRSIRILLDDPFLFRTQIRALLRASVYGKLKILIPMISSLEDVRAAVAVIQEVKRELDMTESHIPIGIMVEIPSAALEIEKLLAEVDFASIGTNDLIQYTLAVDRNNEKVAAYYQPLNGAVLSLIEKVVQAGGKLKKEISICGEMAGDPHFVPLLIALGIRNLSMHPAALPRIKNLLLKLTNETIGHIRKNYRKFTTVVDLTAYLDSNLRKIENGNSGR
jgi:phosphotransferase system enzyme I (PtsI)